MNIDYSRVPMPDTETPEFRPFWEGTREGVLKFPRCMDCGQFHWYPQPLCPNCHGMRIEWVASHGKGIIYSWSVPRRPFFPPLAESLPFNVALVELDDVPGPRLVTNIVDCVLEEIRIGLPVAVVFRPVAKGVVLPLFRIVKD